MSEKVDRLAWITSVLSKAIDALMVGNPVKTSLGVLLGVAAKYGADFAFDLAEIDRTVPAPFTVPAGVLLMHSPNLIHKHNYDENLESAIYNLKELQKSGNFSEAEKRRQWRKLVDAYINKLNGAPMTEDSGGGRHNTTTTA